MTGISYQIEVEGNTLNITPGHVALNPNKAEIIIAEKMSEFYSKYINVMIKQLAKSGFTVVVAASEDLLNTQMGGDQGGDCADGGVR